MVEKNVLKSILSSLFSFKTVYRTVGVATAITLLAIVMTDKKPGNIFSGNDSYTETTFSPVSAAVDNQKDAGETDAIPATEKEVDQN